MEDRVQHRLKTDYKEKRKRDVELLNSPYVRPSPWLLAHYVSDHYSSRPGIPFNAQYAYVLGVFEVE